MSVLGLVASVGFAALSVWGMVLGIRGALADAPPFMAGVGAAGRYDTRLKKSA